MSYDSADAVRAAQRLLGATRTEPSPRRELVGADPTPRRLSGRRIFGSMLRIAAITIGVIVAWNVLCSLLIVGAIVAGLVSSLVQHAGDIASPHPLDLMAALQHAGPRGTTGWLSAASIAIVVAAAIPLAIAAMIGRRLWIMLPAIGWRLYWLEFMVARWGRR